jgi:hypothetical protein
MVVVLKGVIVSSSSSPPGFQIAIELPAGQRPSPEPLLLELFWPTPWLKDVPPSVRRLIISMIFWSVVVVPA